MKPSGPQLNDDVLDWLEPFVATKQNVRAALPGVKDQRIDYRQKVTALATDFAEKLGRRLRVEDLFSPDLDLVLRERRDRRTGAPLLPASRDAYRRVLNAFVTWLKKQPDTGLDDGVAIPWLMERPAVPEPRVFEPEVIRMIFADLSLHDSIDRRRQAAILAISLDCGGRRGDVLSLRLSALDLPRRRAELWVKNNKRIWVPLGALAYAALVRYLDVRRDVGEHDLVFLNAAGTAPINADTVTKALRRQLMRLGIVKPMAARRTNDMPLEPERLNVQALRRTFVKHYLEAGRSERELAAMVGWHPDYAHLVFESYTRVDIDQLSAVHEHSSPLTTLLRG